MDNGTYNKLNLIFKDQLQVDIAVLKVPSRRREIVRPRNVLIALLKEVFGWSYPQIARYFGKNHTTMMHSYIKANRALVDRCKAALGDFESVPKHLVHYDNQSKWRRLYRSRGAKCQLCGFNDVLEVHHLISKKIGGTDELSNLLLLCPNHHKMLHAGMVKFNVKDPTSLFAVD